MIIAGNVTSTKLKHPKFWQKAKTCKTAAGGSQFAILEPDSNLGKCFPCFSLLGFINFGGKYCGLQHYKSHILLSVVLSNSTETEAELANYVPQQRL